MKRLFRIVWTIASSRLLTPAVIGFFLVFYIVLAFFTDEALTLLLALTRRNIFIAAALAALPLNCLCRIFVEACIHRKRQAAALSGKGVDDLENLFDEVFAVPVSNSFSELQKRLSSLGYKTRLMDRTLNAWRGLSNFPARIVFLAATFCLFAGILVSTTSKTVNRAYVVEGMPLPSPAGNGGNVERIVLANSSGSILARTLDMVVDPSSPGNDKRDFGLYPPSLFGGSFVYPRYLGLALFFRFASPDMQQPYEMESVLNVYPPGKEDSVAISGSPYRVIFSISEPGDGEDRYESYMSGRVPFQFKVVKGKDVLFSGGAPGGGEYIHDGYRLSLHDVRRLVVTDFVHDYGVYFIWAAVALYVIALFIWLPLRVLFPRGEMLFTSDADKAWACSRVEGQGRRHDGVFHEALDMLDSIEKG